MSNARSLRPEPLTRAAFAAFGDVIEAGNAFDLINSGTTQQYRKLTDIDVSTDGGKTQISLYRVVPYRLPHTIDMLERHPLSSQLFMPLNASPFLVVVAPAGERIDRASVRAFVTNGAQGVNYRRGTWHHPVIALANPSEFLVVDRVGPGANCDEVFFDREKLLLESP
ncbi:MAG TPA: ureidoglycolate lyase [Steroidobacteraceae bacterium]|nr:ureidoglycolate lyase [Steroidobacteraceae bacterium]